MLTLYIWEYVNSQLTGEQIPGLSLRTWACFLHEQALPVGKA